MPRHPPLVGTAPHSDDRDRFTLVHSLGRTTHHETCLGRHVEKLSSPRKRVAAQATLDAGMWPPRPTTQEATSLDAKTALGLPPCPALGFATQWCRALCRSLFTRPVPPLRRSSVGEPDSTEFVACRSRLLPERALRCTYAARRSQASGRAPIARLHTIDISSKRREGRSVPAHVRGKGCVHDAREKRVRGRIDRCWVVAEHERTFP
jgi:hypothetical protein